MNRKLCGVVLLVMAIAAFSMPANADSTWTLNCTLSATTCTTSGPWGTVSVTDPTATANTVGLSVALNQSGAKTLQLDLNYTGTFLAGYYFQLSTGDAVQFTLNGIQADGYTSGKLDLQIPDNGNLGNANPWTGTLQLYDANNHLVNLDASNFNAKDTNNLIYAAVHSSNDGSGNSIWLGAKDPTPPPSVPEPASIFLFGSGLSGIGMLARKFRK